MMRILQVIPFFTPKRGGSVDVAYNLSRQLSTSGHDVTIVTTDFEFDKDYAESLKSVVVLPFPTKLNAFLFLYTPSLATWLDENIKKFDIIHLHNFRSYQNNVIRYYAKKYNVPYVLQAHGSLPRIVEKQKLKSIYDWIWGNKILRDASRVIAIADKEAKQYKGLGLNYDKIEIIPNGIELTGYENLPRRGAFKKKYMIDDTDMIILYLGRIHKIKGLYLLVNAFEVLSMKMKNIKLVIAGPDDGFLSSLKNQIRYKKVYDKLLITGPLYGEDKLKAYVDANVYVLPSVYEMFPVTVLEACACGTPVVVTDCCGIADIVDGHAGIVVRYDVNELENALFHILNDKHLQDEMKLCGKQLVYKEFNWPKIARMIEGMYLNVLNNS